MPRKRLSDNLVPVLPNTMYLKSKTESQVLAKAHLGIANFFLVAVNFCFQQKKNFSEKNYTRSLYKVHVINIYMRKKSEGCTHEMREFNCRRIGYFIRCILQSYHPGRRILSKNCKIYLAFTSRKIHRKLVT